MIEGVDKTVEFLRLNNLENWKVKVKEGDNSYVFQSSENQTLEDNIKRFKDVMNITIGGKFILIGYPKAGANKGNYFAEFSNLPTNPPVIGNIQNSPATMSGVPEDRVAQLIHEALEKERVAREIDQLKNENKDLKADLARATAPINKMIGRMEPYIGQVLGAVTQKIFSNNPLAIAGDQETIVINEVKNINDMSENQDKSVEERIQDACQKWSDADEDFLEVMEFLANFAKSGESIQAGFVPLNYVQVKNMILNKEKNG